MIPNITPINTYPLSFSSHSLTKPSSSSDPFHSMASLLSLLSLFLLLPITMANTTDLHFYMHDTLSGRSPTAIRSVVGPVALPSMPFNFGDLYMIDDPLTRGPSPSSEILGRAQGFYSFASLSDQSLLLAVNLVLDSGEYNGSTLTVLGRDRILDPVRELPVVGGTGAFRMTRGYVLLKTNWLNQTTGDAVVEMDVHVFDDADLDGGDDDEDGPAASPEPSHNSNRAIGRNFKWDLKIISIYICALIFYTCGIDHIFS
ncbi:dirigent protein 23-like [Typha latifolia]|uniref:dirigent protein 23-like n=1 Tax=Typha latifolia TaxID=4733 RepID=UPI003C2D9E94